MKYSKEVLLRASELHSTLSWDDVCPILEQEFGLKLRPDTLRKLCKGRTCNRKSFDDKVQDEKDKILTAQEEAPTQTEIKRRAWQEVLLTMLKDAITPLRCKVPVFTPIKTDSREEEIVLILSDLHFGKKNSTYDIEIALARIEHILNSVIKIASLHRNAYQINHLHIIWAGDIVDGDAIFPTHSHHLDGNVMKQLFGASPRVATALVRLAGFFKTVNNHCIRGNHGRFSKQAHEDDNFDFIFYHVLAGYTREVPNMTWDIGDGWYKVVKVLNTRILAVHGHQIKMTLNLPWYGITTRIARWAITNAVGGFDVAVLGHFHTSSRLRWNNKIIFTNGTTVDGDEFALEVLGLEGSQNQWLFSIHPDRGVTWAYELDCVKH